MANGIKHIVMDKKSIRDCLMQCLEDYIASYDDARIRRESLLLDERIAAEKVLERCIERIRKVKQVLDELI